MTTFSITINNTLNLFGPQDTNKWGSFVWGVDNWAYSQFDLPVLFIKEVNETLVLTDSLETFYIRVMLFENELTLTNDLSDEYIVDGNGYYRYFGTSTNAENRPLTSYTGNTGQATAYTSVPRSVTSYTT